MGGVALWGHGGVGATHTGDGNEMGGFGAGCPKDHIFAGGFTFISRWDKETDLGGGIKCNPA